MLTNFPNGVSSFGIPQLGGGVPTTFGKYIFVDATNGVDGNSGLSMDEAVKTIAQAYSMVRDNKDDVIVLSTYASHIITSMLNISKSRVHFVGDQFGRMYGQGAKIVMGATIDTADVFAVKNTGVRNTFAGIKFDSGNDLTEAIGTFGEGGEYAIFRNCEFYNSAKLDSDTHAELVLNGDSPQFFNCTLGSLATGVSGDKIRPAVLMTNGLVGSGKVSRDVLFDGCEFWKLAGGTTTSMIKIASADDLERFMKIKDCTFVAAQLGSVPAVAIDSPTLTKGDILLSGNTIAQNCTKIGTATGIFNGTSERVATATIGIQAT